MKMKIALSAFLAVMFIGCGSGGGSSVSSGTPSSNQETVSESVSQVGGVSEFQISSLGNIPQLPEN